MTVTDLNEIDYIPISHLDERYISTDTLHNISWPLKRESNNNRICVSVTVHDCIETKVDLMSRCQQHRRPIGGQSERFHVICSQYHRSDTRRKGWKDRQKSILVSSDVVSEHKLLYVVSPVLPHCFYSHHPHPTTLNYHRINCDCMYYVVHCF